MPYYFSKRSIERLNTCDPRLVALFNRVISLGLIDMTVIWGHRGEKEQEEMFRTGRSRVKWPHSKHNSMPSKAVDVAPYVNGKPSWNDKHCSFLAGIVMTVADEMGIKVRWGGNWDMDGEPITDQRFDDLIHYELVE